MKGLQTGRIVHYRLTEQDAIEINRRRTTSKTIADKMRQDGWPEGAQAHIGNTVTAGQHFPMMIVMVWGQETGCSNGQVFLDGNDVLWVCSASFSDKPLDAGTWHWPERNE